MNRMAFGFVLLVGGLAQAAGVLYGWDTVDGLEAAAYAGGMPAALVIASSASLYGLACMVGAALRRKKR